MSQKKTPEERADEERRYQLARTVRTSKELEQFVHDPNQAIRAEAAANPHASQEILKVFSQDKFWGTRMEVVSHPNTTPQILLDMLEWNPRQRGVVHHAAQKRLIAEGFEFGEDGIPL